MKTIILLCALLLPLPVWAANDITGNPWIIDTAAATVISNGNIRVTTMVWDCGASCALADILTVKNRAGAVVVNFTSVAAAVQSAYVIPFSNPFPIDGLIVSTMGHGKLYIYWER